MGKPPKPRPRTRTASRVAAVQALFQSEQGPENAETVIDQFVRHRLGELPGTGGFEDGRVPGRRSSAVRPHRARRRCVSRTRSTAC